MELVEGLNAELFVKAFLRVAPLVFFFKLPTDVKVPFTFKLLPVIALSIILALRFQNDGGAVGTIGAVSGGYFFDLLLGIAVGAIMALFFSASMQITKFFRGEPETDEAEDSWKIILDSFTFIVLMLLLMGLKIERSILELLASVKSGGPVSSKFANPDLWARLLKEITWLGLKIASFSFVIVFTKSLFEEVYRRLGGEPMKVVFSLCFWLALVAMSPLLLPSFAAFVSEQLSTFWKTWMGV